MSEYTLGVTGSRCLLDGSPFTDKELVWNALNPYRRYPNLTIVTGGASGVDALAIEWARYNGVRFLTLRPDYNRFAPKLAPLMRNTEIVNQSDEMLAVWNGKSSGTRDTIEKARHKGIPVNIVKIEP